MVKMFKNRKQLERRIWAVLAIILAISLILPHTLGLF